MPLNRQPNEVLHDGPVKQTRRSAQLASQTVRLLLDPPLIRIQRSPTHKALERIQCLLKGHYESPFILGRLTSCHKSHFPARAVLQIDPLKERLIVKGYVHDQLVRSRTPARDVSAPRNAITRVRWTPSSSFTLSVATSPLSTSISWWLDSSSQVSW